MFIMVDLEVKIPREQMEMWGQISLVSMIFIALDFWPAQFLLLQTFWEWIIIWKLFFPLFLLILSLKICKEKQILKIGISKFKGNLNLN